MPKTTQANQVIAAVARLGGIASLSTLNEKMDFSGWGTKTPFASVRQIVQLNKRLHRIKPGLYCLSELRDKFAAEYDDNSPSPKNQRTNHSFYQGLLLQMGRMNKLRTYAPPQDKNRKFLLSGKVLGEYTDLPKLPEFGYPNIIRHAKTIDVVWFNRRNMPHAFYEVETTTNIKNSLGKFHALQDFHADFVIVAPRVRKKQFLDCIAADMYHDISGRVKFLSTEAVLQKMQKSAEEITDVFS